MLKAVFLDRDGVINKDYGYVGTLDKFEFLPQVIPALSKLKALGWCLVLVTNQSGIARGMYTEDDFQKLTSFMQDKLKAQHAEFDGIYFCPHHPQAQVEAYRKDCECRKPKPGMFLKAAYELKIALEDSIMVGDHASDLIAAQSAGIKHLVLVGDHLASESPKVPQAQTYNDLADFVAHLSKWVLNFDPKF